MFLRPQTAGTRLTDYVRPAAALIAALFVVAVASADNPRTSWTGADTGSVLNNFNWSDTNNWTNGSPELPGDFNGDGSVDAADYVVWRKGNSPNPNSESDYNIWRNNFGNGAKEMWFDQNSRPVDNPSGGDMTINNLATSPTPILGIVNTSGLGGVAGSGPTGNVSISGNPLRIGSIGIRFGGSSWGAVGTTYSAAAMKPLAINTDVTLAADQIWRTGGTAFNSLDSVTPSLAIGQSRDVHVNTLDTNGHIVTIQTISASHTIVVNSDVIGTGALAFQKGIAGNNSGLSAVRLLGTNTYSGNTNILGARQIIELGSSTVKNGNTIISGPFGTGAITSTEDQGSSQFPAYEPYQANRTLDNDITMKGIFLATNNTTGTGNPGGPYTLTLNGTITVPASTAPGISGPANSSRIMGDNASGRGSGDVIVSGNVLLSNAGGGSFGAGMGGGTASSQIGQIIFNGNIVQQPGAGSYEFHAEGYPTSAEVNPARVQLNGQNTFSTAAIITKKCQGCSVTGANIQLGSSSIVDGSGIVSGPLGRGAVSIGGLPFDAAGNALFTTAVPASIEAVGGARTLANNISLINGTSLASTNQTNLTSSLTVQGSQDLTLSGVISSAGTLGGGGGLIKEGAATLNLTGINTYAGDTNVVAGTLAMTVASPATPWLADGADVYLTTGSTLTLNFPNTGDADTIRSLYIDGALQQAGTWGNSGAAHTTSLISGSGWLNITTGSGSGNLLGGAVPEPAGLALVTLALMAGGTLRRGR